MLERSYNSHVIHGKSFVMARKLAMGVVFGSLGKSDKLTQCRANITSC